MSNNEIKEVYNIEKSTLKGIADAVREMRHEKGKMTPAQIEAKIRQSELGIPISVTNHINPASGEWERPSEYPDLDAIEISDNFDGLYLTYDLRKTPGYGWIGIYCTTWNSGGSVIERGHLENNVFVADETYNLGSGEYFRQSLDDSYGDIQLWRVSSVKQIKRLAFIGKSSTSADNIQNNAQPCVEKVGRLPYVNDLSSSTSTSVSAGCESTIWLEREKIAYTGGKVVGSLTSCYINSYSLQSVDMSEWNTDTWTVTSLSGMFQNCFLLNKIDFSSWNTENWAVTSLYYTFSSCMSLKELNLSQWNTENWAVTTLAGMCQYCYSLEKIDFANWDTSNWAVTSLNSTFYYCMSLRFIDMSMFNTDLWQVTSLSSMFSYCYALEFLRISNFNTANWAVTSFSNMFNGCMSLKELDLSHWDTQNWAVIDLNGCFGNCRSLKILDITTWDTSNWSVTKLSSVFSGCNSLLDLDLSNWETENWEVTTLASMFNECWSLKSIDVSTWDTSNWSVTSISSMFAGCRSIEELDLSHWNTENWEVTTMANLFAYCYALREIDISTFDMSNWPMSANDAFNYWVRENLCTQKILIPNSFHYNGKGANISANFHMLQNFSGADYSVDHTYVYAIMLTHDSLVSILTNLPTVSGKKITLGQTNKNKLTAAEIAIATQKGWTVA